MDFPTISGNTEVCQNGLINIEGSQVPDATEYFWKGPNNFNQTGTSLTITNAQPTHSGIYTFFAVRPGGTTCDTAQVEVSIVVNPTHLTTNNQTICFGETYVVGSSVYAASGIYVDTLLSTNGCDSVITTIVTVSTAFQVSNPRVICEGQSVVVGNSIYYTPGTYIDTLISTIGCDSIVTTIITTQNPTLNTAVAIDGITLSAVENNATYQWVDCNNNNAYINGATGQSFSPAVNGSYGVILTSTICTDVTNQSPCYTINSVGVADISQQLISIYPNPTSTQVTIKSDKLIQIVQVKDLNGKLIYEVHSNAMETVIDLGELSDGVYILEITSDFGSKIERIIKQH